MIDMATLTTVLAVPLALAFLLAGWRMVTGPSFADRFVALDMLTAIAVGFAALTTLATGRGAFLDIALGISLINFVATAAFAVFLERKRRRQ
ncbi:multicomponent Na+:H+ antiporter subunit F [Sphingobium sp. B2D3A]|uniref:monovalent cation/H+ antiporter complex subunit F n=1 Tax=Sphingobium TaxID=165695 RepID=UPI0015EB35F9|nr:MULTISPECIES: monovalent cation/H+ antiporter complex subunit F [Sphingobium]MCW2335943.1 multicomponent Na+:H+ antiporter subunit F [Sphingobium sp. B2D3A]MCW2363982.1 multicomponent Na+:H+ antiporter subunit F [Sphingobium sp. B10D3B]MCW2368441.1 multicomponent Na+:H+ antiporter subunit F [Sphingobium sp. B11D3D]MCW2382849.1 multicomponent Na+:H+ antiporter subunit F [Sphingobium sp. B2D3B]MCW2385702.1 multicomponent Na+:H+ antiporter subunit F [Sphingobium sp. B2D3D]